MNAFRIPAKTTLKIANVSVDVPVYDDLQTSQEIAQQVTQRVEDIQENYGRIDTQAFALRAAYEFAVELAKAEKRHHQDEKDTIMALDEFAARLKDVLENFAPDKE